MGTGVVILAAGGSSRMGSPKQLLPYRDETLIRRAARAALGSICDRVVVVIGSCAGEMKRELEDLPLTLVENQDWQSGMSSRSGPGLKV